MGFCDLSVKLSKHWGYSLSKYNPFHFSVFGDMAMTLTLNFNSIDTYKSAKEANRENTDGPVVERQCPQCQNDKMSYATLQLRSADEGQTVFYTCTKCKYVFTYSNVLIDIEWFMSPVYHNSFCIPWFCIQLDN